MRTGTRVLPAVVGLAAFAIYLQTLVPGVGGGGDSAKFQYLGSVLGTAHPPGYPLYVFVSYAFSHLPMGSLAFRINLMSAFFGAVTVALVCATLGRIRCPPSAAAAAALGLAFGRFFWSKATVAEVYTLNAALVALVTWQALRWSDSGRRRDLYLTAALLGLSLGNHLTSAMLAPALALFVLLRRPEDVRVKTAAISIGLGALGLVQYGFILLRTWQRSPYAEAQATNLTELWHVILASKYSSDMFHFSWADILTTRLPAVWVLFAQEVGAAGLLLLAAGLVAAAARRSRPAVLFVAALVGVIALTLNVDADWDGFLLPAFVMAWLLVGLGLTAALSLATAGGSAVRALAAVAVLGLPASLLANNYAASDHHRRTYEARYLDALFAQLEPGAVFLKEEYAVDQLLLYKLAGEGAGGGVGALIDARLDTVQRYAEAGRPIYAFITERTRLEELGFRFEPVRLVSAGAGHEPIDMSYMPLFRLKAWAPCSEIGNRGWRDVGPEASRDPMAVRIDNYRRFDARIVLYAAGPDGHAPLVMTVRGPHDAATTVTSVDRSAPAAETQLAEWMVRDAVPAALRPRPDAGRFVHRLEVTVNDDGQSAEVVISVAANRTTVIARAIVDANDPHRAVVCGWTGRNLVSRTAEDVLDIDERDGDFFGRGWSSPAPVEAASRGRWIADRAADLILPLAAAQPLRVTLRAAPSDDDHGHALSLVVNGTPLPARPMVNQWADYEWSIPAALLRAGGNRVVVDAGGHHTVPEPTAVVDAVTIDREPLAQR